MSRLGPWFMLIAVGVLLAASARRSPEAAADRVAIVPVLMYHHIADLPPDADEGTRTWTVSVKDFNAQVRWLDEHGCHTISCAQLADHLALGHPLPSKPVVLTFDDGWDIGYAVVFPILRERRMTGTFFVYPAGINGGNPAGYMSWDQLREMDRAGMEIASHTIDHPHLSGMPIEAQRRELAESKATIEREIGHSVAAFAYPFGQYDQFTLELVPAVGYTCAFGIEPGYTQHERDRFTLRRNRVSYGDTLDTVKEMVGR